MSDHDLGPLYAQKLRLGAPPGERLIEPVSQIDAERLIEENIRLRLDLQNADRRTSRLEELATRDELTGLGNFRAFKEDYTSAINALERVRYAIINNKPDADIALKYTIIGIDCDRFKTQRNDKYGYAYGSAYLVSMARLVELTLQRSDDTAYRYGGDEYSILAPNADHDFVEQWEARVNTQIKQDGPRLFRYQGPIEREGRIEQNAVVDDVPEFSHASYTLTPHDMPTLQEVETHIKAGISKMKAERGVGR
ncbi:MAG: GGDEF domain-containing protein [Nanoarchaeota archaeon]